MAGADGSLAQVDAEKRYQYITGVLQQQKRYSRYWNVTWVVLAAAAVGGHLALAEIVDDENFTASQRLSAIKAGLGSLSWTILPLRIPEVPAGLAQEPLCKRLAIAEGLLRTAARKERLKRLLDHLTGLVVSVASFVYLYLDRDHFATAALNGGFGLAAIELKAWTSPYGAVHALHRYRRGELAGVAQPRPWGLGLAPLPGGGAFSLFRQF